MSEVINLRLSDVIRITTLSRSTIYELQKIGAFPHSVKVSGRRVFWIKEEVMSWLEERAARRTKADKQVGGNNELLTN